MQPQTKKVVVMTAVSMSIIIFAFLIPVVIIPAYFSISRSTSCTDTSCAQEVFSRCRSVEAGGSGNFLDFWSKGMEGMFCMMGFGSGSQANLYLQMRSQDNSNFN